MNTDLRKKYHYSNVTTRLKRILNEIEIVRSYREEVSRDLDRLRKYIERTEEKVVKLISLLETTEDEQKTGPVQVREEVVGTSSKAKNKNMGNSGFSGGELVAA